MASVREHLSAVHKAASEHHARLADECGGLQECFSSMGKAAPDGDAGMWNKVAGHFGTMAKIHGDAADAQSGFASDCEKAHEDQLSKTLVGDHFTSIAPPDDRAFGIRAVARPGAPEVPGAFDKSSINPNFRHLVENLADEI